MPKQKNVVTCGARRLVAKTCIICNELKSASAFAKSQGVYYHSKCIACNNKNVKPLLASQQAESVDRATRHRVPWTGKDYAKLEEMRAAGKTYFEMASELERTVAAIRNTIFKNNL